MRCNDSSLWHPCTQMKDFEGQPPLRVKHAEASYLELEDGRRVIDAISSWWCKSLGYGHPTLRDALIEHARKLKIRGVDLVNIPDSPRATARMSALAVAVPVQQETGVETSLH